MADIFDVRIMITKKWHSLADLEKRFGPMTLGLFLRSWREAEGASQAQYARKLAISRANLCDLEKGRKIASPRRAALLAKRLGIAEEILVQLALQDALSQANLKYKVELKVA